MATDARRAREAAPDSEPGRVFLVDDDASVRRALVRLLRAQGLSVSSFATTGSPFQVPADVASACLVVDLLMPGLGGLELQELMRMDRHSHRLHQRLGRPRQRRAGDEERRRRLPRETGSRTQLLAAVRGAITDHRE